MKAQHALTLAGLAAFSLMPAGAQDAGHSWSKTYQVTGKPTLSLETADAGVTLHSCGDCREIRVHVEMVGRSLNDYRLEESQNGEEVHFLLKEKPHIGWHTNMQRTQVTLETPAQLTLQARTADGNVEVSGLQGDLTLTTGDGNLDLDHVSGNLRIKSGDGRVKITDAGGSIDAQTSDGNLSVDGLFHALALHTSDGRVDLNLREGSSLTGTSTIRSSDGSVTLRVPENFSADLDVQTSDGQVHCALPLTMDHFQSSGGDGSKLRGKLNGGGAPLSINTSDGSVSIERL
jgi:Putative adhesin